ncbi:GTPase [Streptomyces tardus]|uniref:GTPase n=1 Tax=Streptomyces tardus TaxID=2780544 RepID=UPI003FD713C9
MPAEAPARAGRRAGPAAPGGERGLGRRLLALRELVGLSRTRLEPDSLAEAVRVLDEASARGRLSRAHTTVAVAGPTGCGKSTLFNALAGAQLSEAGVRRPTTATPVACVWETSERTGGADGLLERLGVPPRARRRAHLREGSHRELGGLVLLDLPDHDSLAEGHRQQVDLLTMALGERVVVGQVEEDEPAELSMAPLAQVRAATGTRRHPEASAGRRLETGQRLRTRGRSRRRGRLRRGRVSWTGRRCRMCRGVRPGHWGRRRRHRLVRNDGAPGSRVRRNRVRDGGLLGTHALDDRLHGRHGPAVLLRWVHRAARVRAARVRKAQVHRAARVRAARVRKAQVRAVQIRRTARARAVRVRRGRGCHPRRVSRGGGVRQRAHRRGVRGRFRGQRPHSAAYGGRESRRTGAGRGRPFRRAEPHLSLDERELNRLVDPAHGHRRLLAPARFGGRPRPRLLRTGSCAAGDQSVVPCRSTARDPGTARGDRAYLPPGHGVFRLRLPGALRVTAPARHGHARSRSSGFDADTEGRRDVGCARCVGGARYVDARYVGTGGQAHTPRRALLAPRDLSRRVLAPGVLARPGGPARGGGLPVVRRCRGVRLFADTLRALAAVLFLDTDVAERTGHRVTSPCAVRTVRR